MANDQIQFTVYTPQGSVVSEKVNSVTLQGADGEIGIFPGHVRYIGALGTGILRYETLSGEVKILVVSGGFCHFVDDVLYVLGETVDSPSAATTIDFAAEKSKLQKEISQLNLYEDKGQEVISKLQRVEALESL